MERYKIIWVLLLGATVAGAAWPTYHGDVGLRGVSDVVLPESPELLWRYNAGGRVDATPVSNGERIFFSEKGGEIIALDLKGSKVWKKSFTRTNDAGQEVAARFEAPLVCGGGLVFAGTRRGVVYALDAKTGEQRWKYETEGMIVGSPNLLEMDRSKLVVVDQSEGVLHGLDIQTGKVLWKSEGVARCDGAPGIGNRRIVLGSCLAALHVFSNAGKHLKDIEVGGDGQIAGGVAVDGSFAFAGLRDGRLVCADLEAGDLLWSSSESEEPTFSTPAVVSNRVVYSSDDGFVYAVNRASGTRIWKFDTGGIPTSPVVANNTVVVSSDGVLFLLNRKDGIELWSQEVSDEITSPALIDGMIVVGADDGTVSAFGRREDAETK